MSFSGRKLANSNARFDVYFDLLEFSDGTQLPDFLTVRPKVQDAQRIARITFQPKLDQQSN